MQNREWHDLISICKPRLVSPATYQKKLFGEDCPLAETFSEEQIRKRISFYPELNQHRERIARNTPVLEKTFVLCGWDHTTTVRVYMRETVARIAAELFFSDYDLYIENINFKKKNGERDKDHGCVAVRVHARESEISKLREYIHPGSSYYVYDGEEKKYRPGNTGESEFIITKPEDPLQPERFWRRSQSFISDVVEI
jgi:hypothetical protein